MNRKIKKILVLSLIAFMCSSMLTACKMPFSGKGGKSGGKEAKVELTPGYLNDKISYLASEKVAKKYGIPMDLDSIKSYVDQNYGSNKVNTPSDMLTNIESMKQIVGEEEAYKSYAQVYVESKAREIAQKDSENMTPEEIKEYKTQYKDYLDSLGIPEGERDNYVQKLKQIFTQDDMVDTEFAKAMDEATKEVINDINPNAISEFAEK